MADHEPDRTAILRAIAVGGVFGGILLAIFLGHPAWLLVSLVLFVGTAAVEGIARDVETRRKP